MIYKLCGLPFGGYPRVLSRHPTVESALRAGMSGWPDSNGPAGIWIEDDSTPGTSGKYRRLFHRARTA